MLSAPVDKDRLDDVREMKTTFEKSIVSRCRIPAGATITADMLAIKKPGSGIPPARFAEVLGAGPRARLRPTRSSPRPTSRGPNRQA